MAKFLKDRITMERDFWNTAAKHRNVRNLYIADKTISDNMCAAVVTSILNTQRDPGLPSQLAGQKILDLGCGIGRLSVILARQGIFVTGVDIAANMLERARKHKNIEYITNDGRNLPLNDSSHDAAFSVGLMQHIPNDAVRYYLMEVLRVLKPGGVFVCQFVTGGPESRNAEFDFTRSYDTITGWFFKAGFRLVVARKYIFNKWLWIKATK